MSLVETYLVALLIIFAVPWLLWRLLRMDRWAPLVVVQIVCGILLGPGVLGAAFPAVHALIFRADVITALNGVASWAVILFVWLAGIELDLGQAWKQRRETGLTAALALGVPLAAGMLAGAIILQYPGWQGPNGTWWQAVLGIGMACAVTALPILVMLLDRLQILHEPIGQRILRYASLDDIAIWGVLALILLDWERIGRQGVFLAGFALAAFAMRRAMPRLAEGDRWPVGLVWLVACSLAGDWSGMHYMVGAFLAGAVLDARWLGEASIEQVRSAILLTLMPVYFLSTGLKTDWQAGGPAVFGAAALLLAAAVGGKLLGVHIAGRLLGWSRAEAGLVGWMLQTKALVMIVFAGILLDKAVIAPTTFTALLLMAVASTMLTTPFATPLLKRLGERARAEA